MVHPRGAKGAVASLNGEKIESFVTFTLNLITKSLKTHNFLSETSPFFQNFALAALGILHFVPSLKHLWVHLWRWHLKFLSNLHAKFHIGKRRLVRGSELKNVKNQTLGSYRMWWVLKVKKNFVLRFWKLWYIVEDLHEKCYGASTFTLPILFRHYSQKTHFSC